VGKGEAVFAIQADEKKVFALPGREVRSGTTSLSHEAPEYLPESNNGDFMSGELYDENAPGLMGDKRL